MMGSALAFPARENGHEVRLVGTHLDREIIETSKNTGRHPKFTRDFPAGIKYYQIEQVKEAILGADLVIGGVSSFGVEWFGEHVLPVIDDNTPVLTVTKGLMDTEDGKLLTYPAVWQKKLDSIGKKLSLNAVGGPCTSYELVAHDQTEVAFCGKDMKVLEFLRSIMTTDYYHISLSTDVVGVECAVAMKNAYALGVSLAIGLSERREGIGGKEHYNSQAALFGQSVREMRRLLKLTGSGDDNIVLGAGDLYVTVFGGRTRKIGTLLGRGMSFEEAMAELSGVTLESIVISTRTARAVRRLIEKGTVKAGDFPLLMHIDEIITQDQLVRIPWDSFTDHNYSY
jgi:glycerol-3-phosphate dehydrogenase (NAD(P)+)